MIRNIENILKKYWGYDSFLPLQRQAMESIGSGRDSIVVLPTGGGKSICFQAPALAMPGMTLVVSPLISLMKDQIDALTQCGVPAARIDSTLSMQERNNVLADIGLIYLAGGDLDLALKALNGSLALFEDLGMSEQVQKTEENIELISEMKAESEKQ